MPTPEAEEIYQRNRARAEDISAAARKAAADKNAQAPAPMPGTVTKAPEQDVKQAQEPYPGVQVLSPIQPQSTTTLAAAPPATASPPAPLQAYLTPRAAPGSA